MFAVFLVLPLGYALWMSLHNKGITTAGRNVFVGADNYVKAFTDPVFLEGLWRRPWRSRSGSSCSSARTCSSS